MDPAIVQHMTSRMVHRGPDDVGFFLSNEVGLGVRRLSIIDRRGGKQPIWNEDGTIALVFNGEVYNYRQLRQTLQANHDFKTQSDTETIVHAYEEYGLDFPTRLNGMFAIALWDSTKRRLVLVRDHFGIKPLYVSKTEDFLMFASEIRALLASKMLERKPNYGVIADYLYHDLVDHTDETFFSGINRLGPASLMVVESGDMRTMEYWTPRVKERTKISDEQAQREFAQLFQKAVEMRLVSEVPLGSCLSGGLDSTAIVCEIAEIIRKDAGDFGAVGEIQKTFTAVFSDRGINEKDYAELAAGHVGARSFTTTATSEEFWSDLGDLVFFQEEPFRSTSCYAQWIVMRLAKPEVTVLLDGQGADELLGGYPLYYGIYLWGLLREFRLGELIRELPDSAETIPFLVKEVIYRRKADSVAASLIGARLGGRLQPPRVRWSGEGLKETLLREVRESSLPSLLRYEDKSSIAFSLEARVPFLDPDLVEFVLSLPERFKLRRGMRKWVLRQSVEGLIPEGIRQRKDKIGFNTPEHRWLTERFAEIRSLLLSSRFLQRGLVSEDALRKVVEQPDFCEKASSEIIWRLTNLELWFEEFIDVDPDDFYEERLERIRGVRRPLFEKD